MTTQQSVMGFCLPFVTAVAHDLHYHSCTGHLLPDRPAAFQEWKCRSANLPVSVYEGLLCLHELCGQAVCLLLSCGRGCLCLCQLCLELRHL